MIGSRLLLFGVIVFGLLAGGCNRPSARASSAAYDDAVKLLTLSAVERTEPTLAPPVLPGAKFNTPEPVQAAPVEQAEPKPADVQPPKPQPACPGGVCPTKTPVGARRWFRWSIDGKEAAMIRFDEIKTGQVVHWQGALGPRRGTVRAMKEAHEQIVCVETIDTLDLLKPADLYRSEAEVWLEAGHRQQKEGSSLLSAAANAFKKAGVRESSDALNARA